MKQVRVAIFFFFTLDLKNNAKKWILHTQLYKNHTALFYNSLFNCKNFRQYRQIPTKIPGAAQGCRLGNQAGFVLGPHRSMNVQKNFIGLEDGPVIMDVADTDAYVSAVAIARQ